MIPIKKLLIIYLLNKLSEPRTVNILSVATTLLKVLIKNVLLHQV